VSIDDSYGSGCALAIDLGTASTLVFVRGRGVVLNEPSVIAMHRHSGRVLAVGSAAKQMIGRTPEQVEAVRPLRRGVVADAAPAAAMLRRFLADEWWRLRLRRWQVVVAVPAGITAVERRAAEEVVRAAGARRVRVVEAPTAAALGVGLDIGEPGAAMVADLGGGTTEVAILSLGGVVIERAVKIGGDDLDQAIIAYVREMHGLVLGEATAEQIKIIAGSACQDAEPRAVTIRGLDMTTSMPRSVTLTSQDLYEAMAKPLHTIVRTVTNALAACPPELAADLVLRGIVVTGGGARMHGMDKRLRDEIGVPIHLAEEPVHPVVIGAAVAIRAERRRLPLHRSA
jgi:rod shape-determining protein MreB